MLSGMLGVRWEGEIKDDPKASSLDNRIERYGKIGKGKAIKSTQAFIN